MLLSGWFTEKRIDFEYQSYLLLAYLKKVSDSFNQNKLFPYFPELMEHRKNLHQLKNEKMNLSANFPKELKKINLEKQKLVYKPLLRDDEMMETINSIVEFSLPKIERYIDEGNSIYNLVKEKTVIFPIGVIPIYSKEGYLLFARNSGKSKKANVFRYSISLYENSADFYGSVQTSYVSSFTLSTAKTFENIKFELIRNYPEMPNPATFAVESEFFFPLNETLLPVAKKLLLKKLMD